MHFQIFKRWALRALGALLVAVVVLGALLMWAGPQWLRTRIETQGSATLGRTLTLAQVTLELRSLTLTLSDLRIASADGSTTQLTLPRVVLRADAGSLLRLQPELQALQIERPQLQLTHLGAGHYDVDDIVQRLLAPSPDAGLALRIHHMQVEDGAIDFIDQGPRPSLTHRIRKLRLTLPLLTTLESQRNLPIQPELAFELNGSAFDSRAQGTPFSTPPSAQATLRIHQLDLRPYAPYLPAALPVRLRSGVLNAELQWGYQSSPSAATPTLRISGDIDASQLRLDDPAGAELLSLDSAHATIGELLPLERRLTLDSLDISAPRLRLQRSAPDANANTNAKTAANPSPEPSAEASTHWAVQLQQLHLRDGYVRWIDTLVQPQARLQASRVQLQASDLRWPPREAPATNAADMALPDVPLQLSGDIATDENAPATKGHLEFHGNAGAYPLRLQGQLDAQRIPLPPLIGYLWPALATHPRLQLQQAQADFKGKLRYSASPNRQDHQDGTRLDMQGDAALTHVHLQARTTASAPSTASAPPGPVLLGWTALRVPQLALQLQPQQPVRLRIPSASVERLLAQLNITPEGQLELRQWFASPEAPSADASPRSSTPPAPRTSTAPAEDAPGPDIQIGPITLRQGRIQFSDQFIQPPYSSQLTDLEGSLSGFSLRPTTTTATQPAEAAEAAAASAMATLQLQGRVQGEAELQITGQLTPLQRPMALDLQATVRSLELSPLSAYAAKYAGYGIQSGKLHVDVHYTLVPNGQLTATNHLVLQQVTLGEPSGIAKPDIPLKLALFLLADRNGTIDLRLPLRGSLNDPEFSIGPLIWQAIGNLFGKALTAPFSLFMGSQASEESLSTVVFAPTLSTLSDAARQQLDALAQALLQHPDLELSISGSASTVQESSPPSNTPPSKPPLSSDAASALAANRAQTVRDYLLRQHAIPPQQLHLSPSRIHSEPQTDWTPRATLKLHAPPT